MSENETISKGLELWTIISAYDISLLLLFVGGLLHFASNYQFDILKKFEIKISKENWSILFFTIRDLSLFGSFGISLILINPDMFADVKFPLPFFPLGVILLGIALIYKIKGINTKKNSKIFYFFLILAGVVQYIGFVFVMEAAPEEWIDNGAASSFWLYLRVLRSNLNPQLSMLSFYFSFPILLIILAIMIKSGINKNSSNT